MRGLYGAALVVLILFFLCGLFLLPRRRAFFEPVQTPSSRRCGCVFDIDGTLTAGNPRAVLQMCKAHKCAIGINTARNLPYAADIPLAEMGFPESVLDFSDFVHNPLSPLHVVPTKIKGLQDFQTKWNIPNPSQVLFFDDNKANLLGAQQAGFSTIACSTPGSAGIGSEQERAASVFFSRLSQRRTGARQELRCRSGVPHRKVTDGGAFFPHSGSARRSLSPLLPRVRTLVHFFLRPSGVANQEKKTIQNRKM